MNEISIENFRCFHERQTARLAPLTLLVGENSTGKTSFLAMIRALWEFAYSFRVPDFKEDPYDLGSFDELAHHRGARGSRANTFKAGFQSDALHGEQKRDDQQTFRFDVTFGRRGTAPVPVQRRFARGDAWAEELLETNQPHVLRVGNSKGTWELLVPIPVSAFLNQRALPSFASYLRIFGRGASELEDSRFTPKIGSPAPEPEDLESIMSALNMEIRPLPFASAPVRSKPRRTYDPARPTRDPEGDYVPMYLADLYFRDKQEWAALKDQLEQFGKSSGLFEEISIRPLGKKDSEPFQVQVKKPGASGRGPKGPWRNLIDVGYGVNQALPLITELLRPDAPPLFLLQQPEVHLHPSAQAALGSLFCQVAGSQRQLVVETHSDHLINRVRMDVRDGETDLKPEDVSILYFQREDLDVRIHSLRIDEEGNILHAPDSYGQFFMDETTRSLWKRQTSAVS